MKNKTEKFNCPVGITLSLIGGKYKVVILWYLFENNTSIRRTSKNP